MKSVRLPFHMPKSKNASGQNSASRPVQFIQSTAYVYRSINERQAASSTRRRNVAISRSESCCMIFLLLAALVSQRKLYPSKVIVNMTIGSPAGDLSQADAHLSFAT